MTSVLAITLIAACCRSCGVYIQSGCNDHTGFDGCLVLSGHCGAHQEHTVSHICSLSSGCPVWLIHFLFVHCPGPLSWRLRLN
jgi:hypothetical protein